MVVLVSCAHNKSKRVSTPQSGPAIHKEIEPSTPTTKKIQLPKEDKSDFYKKWALSTGVISVLAYKILLAKELI